MDKAAIIIQARMSSLRFPGKMMSLLCGMPLIEYIYRRCKLTGVGNILVATSVDDSDDILYSHCFHNDIPAIRGSLNNVLERYIRAADFLEADYILRLGGDTPLFDTYLITETLRALMSEDADYAAPDRKSCISGFYSEAVSLKALKKTAARTSEKEDLEHVTKFILEHPREFSVKLIDAGLNPDFARDARITVDYPQDLVKVSQITGVLENKLSFTSNDILSIVKRLLCAA